jgi:hypothetical protein
MIGNSCCLLEVFMRFTVFLSFFLFCSLAVAQPQVSPEGQACLDCHSSSTPGIVEQWRESAHARNNVDCYSCHRANEKEPATFEHYGQRIAVIVTPNYYGCVMARKLNRSKRAIMLRQRNS